MRKALQCGIHIASIPNILQSYISFPSSSFQRHIIVSFKFPNWRPCIFGCWSSTFWWINCLLWRFWLCWLNIHSVIILFGIIAKLFMKRKMLRFTSCWAIAFLTTSVTFQMKRHCFIAIITWISFWKWKFVYILIFIWLILHIVWNCLNFIIGIDPTISLKLNC